MKRPSFIWRFFRLWINGASSSEVAQPMLQNAYHTVQVVHLKSKPAHPKLRPAHLQSESSALTNAATRFVDKVLYSEHIPIY